MAQPVTRTRGVSIWAFILIGVGVIWLLGEANILTGANFAVLGRIWPVILIAAGIALLAGNSSRALSTIIGLGTLVLVIALMVVGPSIGLGSNVEAQDASYTEPLGDAESAAVTLDMALGELVLEPLTDSNNLMEANIRYVGEVEYTSNEAVEREIHLNNQFEGARNFFEFLPFLNFGDDPALRWDVGLNPDVPLNLIVNTGTGGANLNLGDFTLTALDVNTGTGGVEALLPNVESAYQARVNTGTGGITINVEEGAALLLRVNTGTGGATIDLPDDAAVQLTASVGTGGITVPNWLERVSGDEDRFVGDEGVWESENFADAERQIRIEFDGGTGGLTVR